MNVIQEINRINQKELQQGITNTPASWHNQYASSAWVYIGNLPLQLSEGDVLAVMSQWGEIEDINLVREESTGKSKGFAFVKYEDCRSCVLAVDNFNGVKILGRSLRVDHVENYRLPKHLREKEKEEEVEEGKKDASRDGEMDHERIGDEVRPSPPVDDRGELKPGHAYHGKVFKNDFDIHQGQDLFAPPAVKDAKNENTEKNGGAIVTEEERKMAKLQRKAERDRIRREREIRRQEREERKRRKRAKEMEHDGLNPVEESEERSSKHERKKKKEDKQRHSRHHSRRKEQRKRRSLSRSTSCSRSSRDDTSRRRYDSE
jgi:RNA-binding motif X-linked protein 2